MVTKYKFFAFSIVLKSSLEYVVMKTLLYSSVVVFILAALSSCGKVSGKYSEESIAGGSSESANLTIDMSAEHIAKGKETYIETCAPCHGTSGKGDGPASVALNPKPRDHTNGAYMDKLSNAHIFTVIKQGGAQFGYPGMPAQPQLSEEKIKDVIAFVRTLSSNYHKQ
jgi:mono/diheme cytochrome c family protein